MNVMLLAAGEGTRLRPYTQVVPKPAMPFLNIPLAAHALGFLHDISIDKLVVNTYHLPDKIHALFETLPRPARSLHFSDEKEELLGSGGGLGKARAHFLGGGDFIMMNADEVILPLKDGVLKAALEKHRAEDALATLIVMDHPGIGTEFGGVWCDDKNHILGFGKSPIARSQRAWHFIGVQIFSERIFSYIPEHGPSNILYDAVTRGLQKGEKALAYPIECRWFETGNPKDFLEASAACFKYLWSPQNSSEKTLLRKTLKNFGAGEIIVENTGVTQSIFSTTAKVDSKNLSGLIIVGKNGVIEKSCELRNCIIGPGARVRAGTQAQDALFL